MSAELVVRKKSPFSVAIRSETYQKLINQTLGDPARAARFVASISAAVAVNPALQECTAGTILTGALLGESLNLAPSPQLGQYYLVPFKDKIKDKDGKTVWKRDENGQIVKDKNGKYVAETESHAVFVLGYKGYIQLAIRSGYYRNINVVEVKAGEFRRWNPLTEDFETKWITDPNEREKAPTVGYVAMFEYLNGFRKVLYWTVERMVAHADRYSPAFSAADYYRIHNGDVRDEDMWKYSSFWYKDFDAMAKKTMLRQLISHWGIMNAEMQTAMEKDDSFSEITNGEIDAPETPDDPVEPTITTDSEEQPEESEEPIKINLNDV